MKSLHERLHEIPNISCLEISCFAILNLLNHLNHLVFLFSKDAIIADLFLSDLGHFLGY